MILSYPLVSICCLTYNHQDYVRDCLDGFIKQKISFPIEILIYDDASKDETANIIREFEELYPNIVKPIYQFENQYSKGVKVNTQFNFSRVKGKYIALCEGDDYWTDPYKLQKQVDFLEKNPDYSVCVGGFINMIDGTGEKVEIIKRIPGRLTDDSGYAFSLADQKNEWLTKTLTAVFRRNDLNLDDLVKYKYGRDINLFYHLLKNAKAYYFTQIFGVYRVHEGGVNSMKQGKTNITAAYNCYKELYEFNKDEFTRAMNLSHTLGLFNYNLYHRYDGNTIKKNLILFYFGILLIRKLSEIRLLVYAFIPKAIRGKVKRKQL